MIDTKKIEQIARQVHDALPKGVREFGDDVEKENTADSAGPADPHGSGQP